MHVFGIRVPLRIESNQVPFGSHLSCEAGDVERGVALLGGGVDVGAAREELADDGDVALLGGEVQRVEPVGVARVDVGRPLEELEHLLQVAAAGGAQEARIVVGLKESGGAGVRRWCR